MLLFTLLSIFVPYDATFYPILSRYNESAFNDHCNASSGLILTLILPDRATDASQKAVDMFTAFVPEISQVVETVIVTSRQVPELYAKINPKQNDAPFIVLLYQGTPQLHIECPAKESELFLTLRFWLSGIRYISLTPKVLFSALGTTPYAFIIMDDDVKVMFDAVSAFTNKFGPTELVVTTDEVFRDIGYPKERFLLYRKEDSAIVPIKKLNETRPDGTIDSSCLFELAVPDYHIMNEEDLQSKNNTFLAFVSSIYSGYVLDMLHELGPEFTTVLVRDKFIRVVEATTRKPIFEEPEIYVFNYEAGYYYPNGQGFHELNVTQPEFRNAIDSYLTKIRNGEIKPKYFSEPIPDYFAEHKTSRKIVGENFKEYVEDPENDVVMLFRSQSISNTFDPLFEEIANDIIKSGTKNIKFGIIDPYQNSSPKPFPHIIQMPHIEIYLRGHKTESESMFGKSNRYSILRFLKQFVSINLEVPEISKEDALDEQESIMSQYNSMTPHLQESAKNYILKQLVPVTNVDPFSSTKNENN